MEKVTIVITTYNLEKYVSQALDSILMQKTDFDYKILVADDCSIDNTVKILKEYEELYPTIIKVLTSNKNMGSLANSNRAFENIQSEYFTFLDGDDLWIDKNRLQKQVDFMDNHREYSMCAGNTQYLENETPKDMLLNEKELNKGYSFEDYLNDKMPFFHTSSILVRNTIFNKQLPQCYYDVLGTFEECALRGEDFRRLIHLQTGPLYAMNELFSYYRIHEQGMWQGSTKLKKYIEGAISMNYYSKYFSQYYDFFHSNFLSLYKYIFKDLALNYNLLNGLSLPQKERHLLFSLIDEYSDKNNVLFPKKENKKIIKRLLLKILCKLD